MQRTSKQKVTLLIDADVLAYQGANGEQRVYDWGDGVASVGMGTVEQGIEFVLTASEHYRQRLKADAYVLCLTHPTQFRKRILSTYKANRGAKPVLVDPIRDELVLSHKAVRRPELEGDDVLGIYGTHPTLIAGKKIIVSIDKDLKQVPAWVWNPMKDKRPVHVTVEEGDRFHMMQTLTGDPTDNYKGLPGIGPKKAEAILDAPWPVARSAWTRIVEAYEAKGLTEDDALIQARVARICRHTDYDYQRKAPILWQPPR